MIKYSPFLTICAFFFLNTFSHAQKIAVVDVQKVFDGYQKVKEARGRLDKSKKIAMEEIQIFRAELEKIVNELKEMEKKLRNPRFESPDLKVKYQEKVKEAKVKQDDMIAYDKRTKATIAQRQRNLLIEHLADIRAAVQKVAGAKGVDIVLNSSETQLGVFYVGDKFNVTEEVIVTLNVSGNKKN
jgi:Skp family chaperone for outer membrane proteins